MISKVKGIKKLDELIKHNKADDSVYNAIKENETEYKDTKKKIKSINKDIEKLEQSLSLKKKERFKTAIFNVKAQSQLFKEIGELKKQHKQILVERNELENVCNEKEEINSKYEKEIENQYVIYQENEIFIRAVDKIEQRKIDMSADFYKRYFKHVNQYLNAVYSIDKDTKLKEPNPSDLANLLVILKKSEQMEQKRASKAKATTPKRKTRKKVIVLNQVEQKEEKKTATKKKTTRSSAVNQ